MTEFYPPPSPLRKGGGILELQLAREGEFYFVFDFHTRFCYSAESKFFIIKCAIKFTLKIKGSLCLKKHFLPIVAGFCVRVCLASCAICLWQMCLEQGFTAIYFLSHLSFLISFGACLARVLLRRVFCLALLPHAKRGSFALRFLVYFLFFWWLLVSSCALLADFLPKSWLMDSPPKL